MVYLLAPTICFQGASKITFKPKIPAIWKIRRRDCVRYKSAFTKQYPDKFIVQNANRKKKKQQELWQHRGWEHCLRDERDFQQHIDYIHYNPVKHGLVKRATDWQYSSIHRYIKSGMLDKNWGEGAMDFADDIGYE